MQDKISVVQVGLGPIGQRITRYLAHRRGLEIVGGFDLDPAKAGRDLGTLAGLEKPVGVDLSTDVEHLEDGQGTGVAVVCTVSSLLRLEPQILFLVKRGWHVVSTCEELSYPWRTHPVSSRNIDEAARTAGVSVLGTGINPGFAMDFLPLAASGVARHVERVRVERRQDAGARRLSFQQKIGVGVTPDVFKAGVKHGRYRHVGLTESMQMIADRLGWQLDHLEDVVEPVLAQRPLQAADQTIEVGQVAGIHQVGRARRGGKEVIRLVFTSAVGQPDTTDRIRLTGSPNIELTAKGGLDGDIGTAAITVNAIESVTRSRPGLRTMLDVPLLACRA